MNIRPHIEPQSLVILCILAITTAFTSLSTDLITPALPVLANEFQVKADKMRETIYAFFIGFGIAHIFWGRLSDVFGRRIIMITGLLFFCLSTIGCILVNDLDTHLIFRSLQGMGSAAGMILTRAIVRDIYGAEHTTKALSSVFIIFVPITIIMPILGGYLFTHFNWNTAFWVMEIIGILTLLIVFIFLTETAPVKSGKQIHSSLRFSSIRSILNERSFLRNTFSNMFCFTALLIFFASFPSVLMNDYGFTSQQNGYFLAAVGTCLSIGVVVVRILVPRFTIQGTIYLAASISAIGWNIILFTQYFSTPSILFTGVITCLSTIGLGIIFSLTPGQAMAPFTENTGTASSIYGILQYGGASSIGFLSGKFQDGEILPMILSIALCITLSLVNYWALGNHR